MLWLVPLCPLVSFILLALVGRFLSKRLIAAIGTVGVGVSSLIALKIGHAFLTAPHTVTSVFWNWIDLHGFQAHIGLYLDALSLVMMVTVTVVSLLILLYSTEFMSNDSGYVRFFAYMNLFVCSMLILVLADDLLFFYLGWEGVSLCSYLLIGFWYQDPNNGRAATKAFIITRMGDTLLVIGLFIVYWQFGTLQMKEVLQLSQATWAGGSGIAAATTLLFLGGALGKSAQLPLQTWLPDAMAGPTPVSALIHASTMVTAGVYLIARTHALFALTPHVQLLVAIIGTATLLIAGCSALTQHDIKRTLAYSTMSQIGYMFLALGVGAFDAAIFHFMVHAFFKSLLFLSAGIVILAMRQEHNMFTMGGLWKKMPFTFSTFLIGGVSLAALPWVDAGFYSKDRILSVAMQAPIGGFWFWLAGSIGAFITALYTFRMIFVTFLGPCQKEPTYRPGLCMIVPLVFLSIGSLFGSCIDIPTFLGNSTNIPSSLFQSLFSIGGFFVSFLVFYPTLFKQRICQGIGQKIYHFFYVGWGFDWLYDRLFVRPFISFFQWNKDDCIDTLFSSIAKVCVACHSAVCLLQTGRVRWYATTLAIGAVIVLSIMVWA
jgi:NADH-quinone oxidoreductase subunit L